MLKLNVQKSEILNTKEEIIKLKMYKNRDHENQKTFFLAKINMIEGTSGQISQDKTLYKH